MSQFLPLRANVEWLKKSAKDQLQVLRASQPDAKLHEAQLSVAREYGFASWRGLIAHVEEVRGKLRSAFPNIDAARAIGSESIDPGDPDLARLLDAVRDGNESQTIELLARRPALARARGPEGQTPLHVAARCNDARLGIVLLAHDADPQATYGESGHTVLSWAVTCNAMDFARTLVRLGVRPDLFVAAGVGTIDDVQRFFDESGALVPGASHSGSSRFTRDGARLPCPPQSAVEQISDALYIACRNGQTEVVRFLLSKNPDLSFRAYLGATPLHWAYFGGARPAIELLMVAGADPTLRDDSLHCTPRAFGICVAASWGMDFRVRELLEADPTLLNFTDGQTNALHQAAAAGHAEIVQHLLDRGANRTLRDAQGKTPAECARDAGHLSLADLLNST
jgi:cytohesin